MSEHLDMWFEGWRTGNPELLLGAITEDFVYDDPEDGRLTRVEFELYLRDLFAGSAAPGVGGAAAGFESITDIVIVERDGEETAWGWWKAPPQEGAGLVKARPDGVYLEKVTYYTR
jgi:hypothetical protein